MKLIVLALLLLSAKVFSKTIILPYSYYLDIKDYTWKGPVQITIQDQIITQIQNAPQNAKTYYYITPSFCDAQVTLSLNALGGTHNKEELKETLEIYLQHGITYILSVFDPPWVKNSYLELKKKKFKLPEIYFSERPIMFSTKEYGELPKEIYFYSESFQEILNEFREQQNSRLPILLIHRYFPENDFYFTSESLYILKNLAKNNFLSVATFANKYSTLDALRVGIEYLQHPISIQWSQDIKKEHIKKLKLLPLLNVYKNLFLLQTQNLNEEFDFLNSNSNYFNKKIFPKIENSISFQTDISEKTVPFSSYLEFIIKNPSIQRNLILGSGAGNFLSFHGISTIQELKIFGETIQNNFYLKSAIENSCKYIGVNNNRAIQVGGKAELILFKKKPIENPFSIEKVIWR